MEPVTANDFRIYALGELGAIKAGAIPASAITSAAGATPCITPADLVDGRKWLNTTNKSLNAAELDTTQAALLPARAIVISAESGKVAILTKPGVCGQKINAIIVDENRYNAEFIYFSLALKQNELQAALGESAASTTHKECLANLQILMPPRAVQDKLVAILNQPDASILCAPHLEQPANARQQAIFKSWFVDFAPIKAKIAAKKEWLSLQPTHESASSVCYFAEFEDPESDMRDYLERAAMCAISGKTYGELNQLPREQFEQLAAIAALFPDTLNLASGEIAQG